MSTHLTPPLLLAPYHLPLVPTEPAALDSAGAPAPWSTDVGPIYEWMQRYALAALLSSGRSVLDLWSGEGYGSWLLAHGALGVEGRDPDPDVVAHSRSRYAKANLAYRCADPADLSDVADASVGLVTCFDLSARAPEVERLVGEVARVLDPQGVLIVSVRTGEGAGRDALGNPDALAGMLRNHLAEVRVWGQSHVAGALMRDSSGPGERGSPLAIDVECSLAGWCGSVFTPGTLVAAASAAPLDGLPDEVALLDMSAEIARRAETRLQRLRLERSDLEERLSSSERIRRSLEESVKEVTLVAHREGRAATDLRIALEASQGEAARYRDLFDRVVSSKGWRALEFLRSVKRLVRLLAGRGRAVAGP
jgi:SAM-dependent methyltransferase